MPFKSEKQRKWMHANEPDMAKKWEKEEKNEGNIGITTKKGKSIELTHRTSGKEIVVVNTPSVLKKYKKMGYLISMPEGKLEEKAKRDYKAEYKKYGSSTKAKKYRAELNKYNRQKGTYGNGDKKDASHKGGKIVGFEEQSKNRGRAEKSRLKKEYKLREVIRKIIIDEGFGGELPETEKKEFEKVRKEQSEVLGYKLTGKSDVKESVWSLPKGSTTQDVDELDADLSRAGLKSKPDFTKLLVQVSGNKGKINKIMKFHRAKKIFEGGKGSGRPAKPGGAKDIENKAMKAADDANAKMDAAEKAMKKKKKVKEGKLKEDYKNSKWEVYVGDDAYGKNRKVVKVAKSKRAATILYNKLIKTDKYFEVGMRAVKEGKLTEKKETGIDVARRIVKNKQHEKGVDMQTANLIMKIYHAYDKNPALQKKLEKLPLKKLAQGVWRFVK